MKFEEFVKNVQNWAETRGIYAHSTASAQLLKTISEIGELSDAEIKGNSKDKHDAIGDIMACLINYATMSMIDIEEAMDIAWNEIKDRNGKMVSGGAFVKDSDITDR